MRRGLWIVLAILATTALVLTWRDQLPAAPVMMLVIAGLGFGLWWVADRGGLDRDDRPVAAPVQALLLLLAVFGAIAIFWVAFGWLQA
jgi:hypothetical protein